MLGLVVMSLGSPSFWNSSSVFVFHDFNRLDDEVIFGIHECIFDGDLCVY